MLPSYYVGDGKSEKTGRKRKSSMPSSLPKSPSASVAPTSLATSTQSERPSSLPRYAPISTWPSHPQQLPPQPQQHHQQQQQQQQQQSLQLQQQGHQPQPFPRKMDPGESMLGVEDNDQTGSSKRSKLEVSENER
ncbi:hypothetical protein ElyMa_006070600 [Elysia marginata]|uniref:Uncharacterized protein n=1 Tax=Elysia marginata TaxID=1093978 RepID=A0AAV4GRQ9_9GAST|nr:hypothetical protein ElyMa_006070600 [Elysia marginata]